MNNPRIFDCLWKHFSFIGNQGHRINVLPPKGSEGASICRHPKLRTACMAFPCTQSVCSLQPGHRRFSDPGLAGPTGRMVTTTKQRANGCLSSLEVYGHRMHKQVITGLQAMPADGGNAGVWRVGGTGKRCPSPTSGAQALRVRTTCWAMGMAPEACAFGSSCFSSRAAPCCAEVMAGHSLAVGWQRVLDAR